MITIIPYGHYYWVGAPPKIGLWFLSLLFEAHPSSSSKEYSLNSPKFPDSVQGTF